MASVQRWQSSGNRKRGIPYLATKHQLPCKDVDRESHSSVKPLTRPDGRLSTQRTHPLIWRASSSPHCCAHGLGKEMGCTSDDEASEVACLRSECWELRRRVALRMRMWCHATLLKHANQSFELRWLQIGVVESTPWQ